jgi:hypothetical protein
VRQARILSSNGPITAVAAFQATAEQREEALSISEARGVVRSLRSDSNRRTLVDLYRISRGMGPDLPSSASDHDLVSAITGALEDGRVLFFEGWDFAPGRPRATAGSAKSAVATVVRAIMGERKDLVFEGRRYRLVDASRSVERDRTESFRPVRPFEIPILVKKMADTVPKTPDERDQWAKAVKLIDEPERNGALRILRYTPPISVAPPSSSGPATTPSQLRPLIADDDWIELVIVYDDGVAFTASCTVELPGGKVTEGPPDDGGLVRIDGLTTGACKLSFPDLKVASSAAE